MLSFGRDTYRQRLTTSRSNERSHSVRLGRLDPFARVSTYNQTVVFSSYSVNDLSFQWQRAEIHVLAQLRAGRHPILVQQDAEAHLSSGVTLYHRSVVRIIGNMRNAGRFYGIPTIEEYRVLRALDRARIAADLRHRFYGCDDLGRYARDEEIERDIARSRALDRQAEQELRNQKEREWKGAEETYKATIEALRAEVEELQKSARGTPAAINEHARSRTSHDSTAGPSIYPGRDGIMPSGYYGAQTPAYNPRAHPGSHDSKSRRVDLGRGASPQHAPPTLHHSTAGRRGSPPSRRSRYIVPTNANDSRPGRIEPMHQADSHSRTSNWLMDRTISTSPNIASRSHYATAGSSSRPPCTIHHEDTNLTHGHPPSSPHGLHDLLWRTAQGPPSLAQNNAARSRSGARYQPQQRAEHHRGRRPAALALLPRPSLSSTGRARTPSSTFSSFYPFSSPSSSSGQVERCPPTSPKPDRARAIARVHEAPSRPEQKLRTELGSYRDRVRTVREIQGPRR